MKMRISELCVVDLSEYDLKLLFTVNRPSSSQAGDQCRFFSFQYPCVVKQEGDKN